jgi:hypothetical protein
MCLSVCSRLTDSNQIWCSDYLEPGEKHRLHKNSYFLKKHNNGIVRHCYVFLVTQQFKQTFLWSATDLPSCTVRSLLYSVTFTEVYINSEKYVTH